MSTFSLLREGSLLQNFTYFWLLWHKGVQAVIHYKQLPMCTGHILRPGLWNVCEEKYGKK
jgi:hypothetical protein